MKMNKMFRKGKDFHENEKSQQEALKEVYGFDKIILKEDEQTI